MQAKTEPALNTTATMQANQEFAKRLGNRWEHIAYATNLKHGYGFWMCFCCPSDRSGCELKAGLHYVQGWYWLLPTHPQANWICVNLCKLSKNTQMPVRCIPWNREHIDSRDCQPTPQFATWEDIISLCPTVDQDYDPDPLFTVSSLPWHSDCPTKYGVLLMLTATWKHHVLVGWVEWTIDTSQKQTAELLIWTNL